MWADESSKMSRFRLLFTVFAEPPCLANTFFCHSNMCINNTLVCNGVQNCMFPWDENNCKEKKSKSFFQHMNKTHGTVIGVASGVVLLLLIISVFIQMKQPRKKVLSRKGLQEVLEPPQYELFSVREAELSEDLSEELESLQKLRRSSSVSRCVHEHHCGAPSSAASYVMASRVHRLSQPSDEMSTVVGARGWGSFHGRRSSSHSHAFTDDPRAHAYSAQSLQEALENEELELEGRVMEEIGYNDLITRGHNVVMERNHANPVQHRSLSMDF